MVLHIFHDHEVVNLAPSMLGSFLRMPLSFPVTTGPVYLWRIPNKCFRSIPVFGWPGPNLLKCVAATKLTMSIYLQKIKC